eukprot:TRINITY_DN216_c0_g1_i5.p1 TRINITY_DN216_c0_g1~~TRINITY_DN216_c0_g1_i5.p1  ORF type:complete len:312 (-),score=59.23 TRINITY_DN216_c0_g1_i5:64-999(-)
MLREGIISVLMECLSDSKNEAKESQIMLLANLTLSPRGADQLLQRGKELEGLQLLKLVSWFVKNPGTEEKDTFQFAANIFANVTQTETGRKVFLNDRRGIIKHLIPFVTSTNLIRKIGVLRAFRNCCREREFHEYLVSEQLGMIDAVLTPLLGPEFIDDEDQTGMLPTIVHRLSQGPVREQNVEVRKLCVQIIHLLVLDRPQREYLRSIKVYPILRELHKVETDEELMTEIEDLVQFFIGDEEPVNPNPKPSPAQIEVIEDGEEEKSESFRPVPLPQGAEPEVKSYFPKNPLPELPDEEGGESFDVLLADL